MVEVYDSHEQGERVKGWLRENGGAILLGLVLAFGGLFGFKQWQGWQDAQAQRASAEYESMVELLDQDRLDAALDHFEILRQDFSGSAYASMAVLRMAKARVEAGQAELAVGLLEDAMQTARPEPVRVIARERLARVLLDQGEAERALALIDGAPADSGLESRFAELRGDVYRFQGRTEEALAAYDEALSVNEGGVGSQPMLEMKRQQLAASLEGTAGS
jgi:predicted negative regulator of RcsB-dependent stress response